MTKTKLATLGSIAALTLAAAGGAYAQASAMTFFVTSTGSGKGADFGGLAGADKLCQSLAAAVGAGGHDVARLPEHAGRRRGRERARPHRQRPVAEREGRRDREERRRAARRATT